ncbi:DUF349 domain-containing protein [Agromyces sp. H3Y2-19a]|uniref:DUF349 domain-containing protein n=1 Tax=Agromyces TaxID=33877 RepID=UPI001E51719A|nr:MULTISPECIES: DUF349 domain-containing protein [Agromyces]MCD5347014.1 DUF349 domain-containing protein [Agromyces sp. S2-1-8]MDF0515203.1 DUF349 domain-containing protein [Agromyces chromiiresistens]
MTESDQQPWGRVDETGTVFVRTSDGEREVGQYPDATAEEALAYFERKYADLAGQVTLLEQRVRRGAPAADVAKAVAALTDSVADAHAVGDLDALSRRLEALSGTTKELTEQQQAEAKAALGEAITERTRIVEQAERLAAQDPAKTQWKQTSAELDALFASWQRHQQEGPRLPKGEANDLWKRFRAARSTIEQHRKAFFAELDASHRDVRARKQRLIERAEALAPRGADAVGDYRSLLDEWKLAGRAGKKLDDQLWARFKAAGDVLFDAKAEIDAKEDEAYRANLDEKLVLLTEAEVLLGEKDPKPARAALNRIQRQWDEIGRVPRDQVRPIEDRLRKVENHVRSLEDERWQREDPEKKARSEGMLGQLQEAIEKLESELSAAEAAGDDKAAAEAREALEARRAWLKAVGG